MPGFAIQPKNSLRPVLEHLSDGISVCMTLWMVQWMLWHPMHDQTWICSMVAAVVFFIVGELFGLYRSFSTRTVNNELATICFVWLGTLVILSGVGFATRVTDDFPRSTIGLWFFVGGLSVAVGRMILRVVYEQFAKQGVGVRRCAIVGVNPLGIQIADNAQQHPECGMKVVGFFDDREEERRSALDPSYAPFMGKIDNLVDRIHQGQIDTVLITLPMKAEARIRGLLEQLSDTTAGVYIVPDFFVFELLHSQWTNIGGLPVVSIFDSPIYGVDGWSKRLVDVLFASLALLLFAPVLLVCAVLVKMSSPGPIFFRQKRFGLDGKEILVWKFRSMKTCDNGAVVMQATRNDPRVTKTGAVLRKTSLDELPQLFNVLGGSMSLVGPRPLATAHNQQFRRQIPGFMLRHKVKPGITGLAQVSGNRGETDTPEKMRSRIELDHRYIREWSIWLDLKIMFQTVFVVLKQENAY